MVLLVGHDTRFRFDLVIGAPLVSAIHEPCHIRGHRCTLYGHRDFRIRIIPSLAPNGLNRPCLWDSPDGMGRHKGGKGLGLEKYRNQQVKG